MPEIGDICSADKLGYHNGRRPYIYICCPDCGTAKWMLKAHYDVGRFLRCRGCGAKSSASSRQGSKHYNWRGGRKITSEGYIRILLRRGDRFYEMADSRGYVLEHRLVMARQLDRSLSKNEQVHHRPDVAKDDNRIEVLYVMPNRSDHSRLGPCSNCELKKEIRLLSWQVRELTAALQLKLGDHA